MPALTAAVFAGMLLGPLGPAAGLDRNGGTSLPAAPAPAQPDLRPILVAETATDGKIDADTLIRVQLYLERAGHAPGPADGVMGGATRTAIEKFQESEGRPKTGEVTAYLLDRAQEATEFFKSCEQLWQGSRDKEGSRCVDALNEQHADFADGWLLRGVLDWGAHDYAGAVAAYDQYTRIDPDNALVWANKAANLLKLERYAEMETSLQRARDLDPKDDTYLANRVTSAIVTGQYHLAREALISLEEIGKPRPDYDNWTRNVLRILEGTDLPPAGWRPDYTRYGTVVEAVSSPGFMANFSAKKAAGLGTKLSFRGSEEGPFKLSPGFTVWDGAVLIDPEYGVLLDDGTKFKYTVVTGADRTTKRGVIANWRAVVESEE